MNLGFFILSTLCAVAFGQEVTVRIEPAYIKTPQGFSVYCEIKDLPVGGFVTWYKHQPDHDPDVIGFNEAISNPTYMDRFTAIGGATAGDITTFMLQVDESELGDGGKYGCAQVGMPADQITYAELVIGVGLGSLEWWAWREDAVEADAVQLTNDERLPAYEGGMYYLKCTARGSNPAAKVTLSVNGERDITEHFEETQKEYTDESIIEPFASNVVLWQVDMKSKNIINVTQDMSRQKLICRAEVANEDPVEIFIIPILQIAPRIECQDDDDKTEGNQMGADLYSRNTEISCTVLADPMVNASKLAWTWRQELNNGTQLVSIYPDQAAYGRTFRTTYDEETEKLTATLKFSHISSKDMFQKYELTAENELGTRSDDIHLIQDGTIIDDDSGASVHLPSSLALALSVIAAAVRALRS